MQYLGDYVEDYATLNFKFSTHKASGEPITLAGTPAVSVYKANSTTQSTAGITLTVDFDSLTGLHNVLIDLSADAFYAVANDYCVVITTGTVDSVSVVGTVLAHFSIENRNNKVDVTKISGDSTAADNCESFFDGTGYAGGTAKLKVDLDTIKTQAVTCAAGVTILANVGFAGAPGANNGAPTTNGTKINQTVDLTAGQTIAATVAGSVGGIDGVTFPANFEHLSITDTTGLVDITQTAADKVWGTAARVLTANTNLSGLEVDLTKIHGTALTETAGQLAAAFVKFFDVATPVLTCESVNQAQDNATTAEIKTALEADGSKLDHLWEMTEDDGGTRRLTTNALEQAPSGGLDAAGVAAAVWDAVASSYDDAGSMGALLNDAGAAGDPWSTALPGAYGSGTAGKIIGDNLNATVGSRSSHDAADVAALVLATPAQKLATDASGYVTYANAAPPSAADVADAVWDEAIADHTTGTTFGGKNQKVVPSETINDYKATGFSTHSAADVAALVLATPAQKVVTDASGYVTANLNGDLTETMKTSVNGEVVDALGTDTLAELSQGAPPATPTIKQALMLLYMAFRNERTSTDSLLNIKNDAGTVICKATLSDDGTTFTKAEFISGA